MGLKKTIAKILVVASRTSKLLLFFTFLYTAWQLFVIRSHITAILILFAIGLFLALNQIDSINRRLAKLEEGKNGKY